MVEARDLNPRQCRFDPGWAYHFKERDMRTIEKLASEFGYTLINNNTETDNNPLINACMVAGTQIFVGEYDNEEFEVISFFHEYGHSLVSPQFRTQWNFNTLMIEIEAWNLGLEFARQHDYIFSDDAIKWAYEQALTYVGHDEREDSSWETRVKPTLWIPA